MKRLKIVFAICLLFTAGSLAAPALQQAKDILQETGVQGGLVVHVGCGEGALTAALCTNERFVVQGLTTKAAQAAQARELLYKQGILGPASAIHFNGRMLPYAGNLVRLLVVENTFQLPREEMLRVLAPGGVAYILNGDRWEKTVKPWPDNIDRWTHLLHGADNNAVADDSVVGPPRRMQWQTDPMWCRSHEFISSFVSMVSDKGRVFFLFDEGLTGVTDPPIPERWTLIARDAFSGVLLWKRPMKDWNAANFRGRGRGFVPPPINRTLVAQGDFVYTVSRFRGAVVKLNAATGEEIQQYAQTEGTEEIVFCDDTLLVRTSSRDSDGQNAVVALNPKTGQLLWERPENAFLSESLAARDGHAVYANREALFYFPLESGDDIWSYKSPDFKRHSWSGGPRIVMTKDNILVGSGKKITALGLKAGAVMWEQPSGGHSMRGADMMVVEDLVWHANDQAIVGYDLKTGEIKEEIDPSQVQSEGHHLRCYPSKGTHDYLITQFRGVEMISLSGEEHVQNDWTRGACRYGVMPSNGLLYVPPHPCFCYAGAMMTGLNAYAPATDEEIAFIHESAADSAKRVERGSVWGSGKTTSSQAAWPMYRGDAKRSGATSARVSDDLSFSWKTQLGGDLTQPVVSQETVFVADKERQALYALNRNDGGERWHYLAGSRIDSAPTLLGNMVIFGCADGYVYNLRASDGALIWRFRAAPSERTIMINERLESAWPCHGSVLAREGLIYFTAGRSSYLDGGLHIYALEPKTAEVVHQTHLDTWSPTREDAQDGPFLPAFHIEGARSDILVSDGDSIFLNQLQFTPALEQIDTAYRPGLQKYEEDRGAPDAFGPLVSEVSVDNPDFVDREVHAKFPEMANSWFRRGHLGARQVERHLFATGGFLDDTYFHRTYWMYSNLWPGYYIANVAPKTGQLLVVGPEKTYAMQAYPQRVKLSPMFKPGRKGYLLIADGNENDPIIHEKNWGRDKGMGVSRKKPPVWSDWVPIRIRAMTLAGDRLFVGGPPDVLKEGDVMASFEGRLGGVIRIYDAEKGEYTKEYPLDAPPVFDGMIAAEGNLIIATTDGEIVCMSGKTGE